MGCGKTLAHRYFNMSSDIYGGFTPTLGDIQTDSEKVKFLLIIFLFITQGSGTVKIVVYSCCICPDIP